MNIQNKFRIINVFKKARIMMAVNTTLGRQFRNSVSDKTSTRPIVLSIAPMEGVGLLIALFDVYKR